MATRQVRLAARQDSEVRRGLALVRQELDVPEVFPPGVLAEAEKAAAMSPEVAVGSYADATDVPFVTIDPPESMDLDQAVHIERAGVGFRVRYAIADVAAFTRPGGAIDGEARRRGMTLYAPDERVPLHPTVLSEGAASLLPGLVRPAALWDIRLDGDGAVAAASVARAMVRSRAKLSYEGVQAELDAGTADDLLVGLRDVGLRREEQERLRGGVNLPTPEQVVESGDGGWRLAFRAPFPVEGWSAQVSLLTGMVAASIMLDRGLGILRTMPPPADADLARVRRTARALGMDWPADDSYAELIRSADVTDPAHLAFLSLATTLLRGAGYTSFDGSIPEVSRHAAVAAPYAHVTAPLRRLVDRFGTEVALATVAEAPVPDWVTAALAELPDLMLAAARTARSVERESLNLVEAVLLSDRIGDEFTASVVDGDDRGGFQVVIRDPGVRAKARGGLHVGSQAQVVLTTADPQHRQVLFTAADRPV